MPLLVPRVGKASSSSQHTTYPFAYAPTSRSRPNGTTVRLRLYQCVPVSVSPALGLLAEAFCRLGGRPIMFWDVYGSSTAMSVSGNYILCGSPGHEAAFLGLLAVNLAGLGPLPLGG